VLQEGEETWLLAGRLEALALEEGGGSAQVPLPARTDLDVPAMHLADPDSRWAECSGLRLHYKLALPLVSHVLKRRGHKICLPSRGFSCGRRAIGPCN
jgi:hypothetical protein